ncbi:MAG: phenylalanine--tRNA ligase subunit beta [Candidatus Saccharimonadales bacterium]
MKVSVNWMKSLGGKGLDVSIDELVTKIGAQLGAVEEIVDIGAKYQGVVVAKVVSCEDHPNADRLHVCRIDDGGVTEDVERGEDGLVQVVCGAPNVREGITVAWLPPKSTVPSSYDTDPFVLDARELRGVVSNGMLASPKELAIGDSHDGILELDDDKKPGSSFAEAYELNDHIIDIENKMFTHRPDLFGQLGVAREIAGISGQQFTSPDWYMQKPGFGSASDLPLYVINELPKLCPRFMAVALKDVTIKPSPVWLQAYLARVGVRPINNVVDITNYIMLLTAQPLHAYDYDKVAAHSDNDATIVVRHPRNDESLELLSGKAVTPRSEAILIATNKEAIGLAGVMGGGNTEVDENTKNIILEVATFDMYSIRKTAMAHGIFTDAVTRFNKGQSPLQNDRILAKTLQMLNELAGAQQASDVFDSNDAVKTQIERGYLHEPVVAATPFINERLGLQLHDGEVETLLRNVQFAVSDNRAMTAPFWRTDIELPEDVVEEVGRLYGYDKLPFELPLRPITPTQKNPLLEQKKAIRATLAKAGANEVLTYSFVHGNLLEKVGQDVKLAYKVGNALSPDLQYYRLSLTPNLLDKVHANIKAGYDAFSLFELNKVHYIGEMDADEPDIPNEDNHLALVIAYGNKNRPNGAPYYHARKYLTQIMPAFGGSLVPLAEFDLSKDAWGKQLTTPYAPERSAVLVKDKQIWGVVGEFKPEVRRAFKLPIFAAGFEIHLGILGESAAGYQPLSKYPKVEQDITLKVPEASQYQDIYDFVLAKIAEAAPAETRYQLTPLDIYQAEGSETKNITLRLAIAHDDKTMTDTEVNTILGNVAKKAKEINAERA